MRQGGRRRKKRLTFGRVLFISVILVAVGLAYIVSYSINAPSSGFPYSCNTDGEPLHVHPYLQIVIDGQNIVIPADIGLTNQCEEPTHTHDSSGIIHVEGSNVDTQYTLGGFFQVWSETYHSVTVNGEVRPIVFNSTDILGFKADATHKVVLLVDGKPSSEYGSLVLNSLDYCSAASTGPPCSPTAVGDPTYGGAPYPFGTGHTIVIEYTTMSG